MSKIARYVGNLIAFASGAVGSERTVFGDVVQSDVLEDNINADFIRGWALGVDINGFPPEQFFNAIGFTATQLAAYLHQMGVAEWDILQEYHIGSFVNVAGELYASLTNTNIGNDPTSDAINWKPITLPATETSSGLVELATDAEAQAFTADKFIDGAKLATALEGVNQSLVASGYQKLPGGLIIQWQRVAHSAGKNTAQTFSYPIAFPNSHLGSAALDISSTTAFPVIWSILDPTLSQIELHWTFGDSTGGVTARTAYVISIGY